MFVGFIFVVWCLVWCLYLVLGNPHPVGVGLSFLLLVVSLCSFLFALDLGIWCCVVLLVYGGGIAVLFLFAIILLFPVRVWSTYSSLFSGLLLFIWFAGLLGFLLFMGFCFDLVCVGEYVWLLSADVIDVFGVVGCLIFVDYAFLFLVVGFLLFLVLLGSLNLLIELFC
jgi:NADH:ubiquinone oxidoreductase subunit 6 (subunit J)